MSIEIGWQRDFARLACPSDRFGSYPAARLTSGGGPLFGVKLKKRDQERTVRLEVARQIVNRAKLPGRIAQRYVVLGERSEPEGRPPRHP